MFRGAASGGPQALCCLSAMTAQKRLTPHHMLRRSRVRCFSPSPVDLWLCLVYEGTGPARGACPVSRSEWARLGPLFSAALLWQELPRAAEGQGLPGVPHPTA